MKILTPKHWAHAEALVGRTLFFLAGPVRGGGDWQHPMALLLEKEAPGCIIACPCRWDETHPLSRTFHEGSLRMPQRQLDWERHYLEFAARQHYRGCIVFWLGCESADSPHPGPEPYAMDTRGELGRWSVHKKYDPGVRLVVGAESGFHGLSQIQRNICKDVGYRFPIYDTMEATAEAAARIALGK